MHSKLYTKIWFPKFIKVVQSFHLKRKKKKKESSKKLLKAQNYYGIHTMMIICKLMITTSFPAQLSHEQSAKISFTPLADFQHFTRVAWSGKMEPRRDICRRFSFRTVTNLNSYCVNWQLISNCFWIFTWRELVTINKDVTIHFIRNGFLETAEAKYVCVSSALSDNS